QFTVSRCLLRVLLGRYLNVPPASLQFGYGDYGKPTLHDTHLQFNLTHSGEVTLVGVTRERPIGIDVELIHHMDNMEELAQRFFAPREVKMLRQVPPEGRQQAFF